MEAIHSALVLGWAEQAGISLVHAQTGEPAVKVAGSEDAAGVGVPFDGEDGGMTEDEIGVYSAPSTGKKVPCSHGFLSMIRGGGEGFHVHPFPSEKIHFGLAGRGGVVDSVLRGEFFCGRGEGLV